jgi:uncharacterized protein
MPDVNLLVFAHRANEKTHAAHRRWLEDVMNGPQPVALSVLVAVGFYTGRYEPQDIRNTDSAQGCDRGNRRNQSGVTVPRGLPGPGSPGTRLGTVPAGFSSRKSVGDAQHAALAMAEGCTWVTRDGDFARFVPHGLSWNHLQL